MMWRTQAGHRYLIRVAASGGQTSLGPNSMEREQIYERFVARKAALKSRQKQLRQTVAQHTRVNRALRVGRVPNVVVDTLNALAMAGLKEHFLTVGTHASQRHDRDPLKRRKDQLQAKVVEQLLTDHGLDHVVRSKGGL